MEIGDKNHQTMPRGQFREDNDDKNHLTFLTPEEMKTALEDFPAFITKIEAQGAHELGFFKMSGRAILIVLFLNVPPKM